MGYWEEKERYEKERKLFFCDSCGNKLKKSQIIAKCSICGNHVCKDCFKKCGNCKGILCKKCVLAKAESDWSDLNEGIKKRVCYCENCRKYICDK